ARASSAALSFFFQAEDGIRDFHVTGVQTCALPICIIRRQVDPFARLATSIAMVWIIGQALVNIAVVLGLLPVLGVPLPFISAGGSSLVTTLLAVGIVLSFARHDPRRQEFAQ